MARAKSGKGDAKSSTLKRVLGYRWILLRGVLIGAALGAIVFFRSQLGNIIFHTIGFGLIMWLIWLAGAVFVAWKGKWGALRTRWNVWLGALALTLAIWGILALLHPPEAAIGDVSFAEVSLGGRAGEYLVGVADGQGAVAQPALRLTLLILAGVVLVAPRSSLSLAKSLALLARQAGLAAAYGLWNLLLRLRYRLADAYGRHPFHLLLMGLLASLPERLRRRPAPEPESAGETIAVEPVAEDSGGEADAEPKPAPHLKPRRRATVAEEPEEAAAVGEAPPAPVLAEADRLPPMELLDKVAEAEFAEVDNQERAKLIEEALSSYGVEATVVQINPGPSVTQFGIEPGWTRKHRRVVERDRQGKAKLDSEGNPIERLEEVSKTRVKVERITALANNLALALAVPSIRIEAPVPGKPLVGIEVPNTATSVVSLRSVMEGQSYQRVKAKSSLPIALGKGTAGESVAADLGKMPHLLIAGETGSGKTVCINSIITCLLMQNHPQQMRLLLIDPKRVEMVSFSGVPHLLSPVVVEIDQAVNVLRRVIREMDNRYNRFAAVGVRNIEGYNRSMLVAEPMPYLVVVIDELAHLMMSAAEVVEPSVCRLAQLSRATGIHLIIATQRPSVDVVTGLIKANFPTRIAFAVTSIVDSRTILDAGGAEKLLGRGDMLYMPPDAAKPKRLRGCFSSDQEIDRVVRFWTQRADLYLSPVEDSVARAFASLSAEDTRGEDPLLATARRLAKDSAHISTSLIQRRLHVGYPRAARIMDSLEKEGTVVRSEPGGTAEVIEAEEEEEEE